MSAPSPDPTSRSFDLAAWLPSRKAWLWVLLAFAAGLLLFALVWLGDRDDKGVATDEADLPPAAAVDEPRELLPTPLPARRGADRIEQPPAEPDDRPQPRLVETTPPPTPPMPTQPAPAPLPSAGAYVSPQPIPGQTPSPRYPARALRRGESGTVIVRAEVGPNGVPISVSVEQGSGSRSLDRAAQAAVRQWRFQPALRDGRPTTGSVVVPISFDPG